jgi:hypothetical protein
VPDEFPIFSLITSSNKRLAANPSTQFRRRDPSEGSAGELTARHWLRCSPVEIGLCGVTSNISSPPIPTLEWMPQLSLIYPLFPTWSCTQKYSSSFCHKDYSQPPTGDGGAAGWQAETKIQPAKEMPMEGCNYLVGVAVAAPPDSKVHVKLGFQPPQASSSIT